MICQHTGFSDLAYLNERDSCTADCRGIVSLVPLCSAVHGSSFLYVGFDLSNWQTGSVRQNVLLQKSMNGNHSAVRRGAEGLLCDSGGKIWVS